MRRSIALLMMLFLLASSGCGAPSRKAKVANAVLTLLTNSILGYATKTNDTTDIQVPCGDGDTDGGYFNYQVPASLTDPLQLITNPNAAAALDVVFHKCVINTCGEKLTLDGGTATLGMGVTASQLVQGAVPAAFTLRVTDQTATGVLEGTLSYAYTIEAEFTAGSASSLKTITIKESDPPAPLEVDGTKLTADKILSLSDGC